MNVRPRSAGESVTIAKPVPVPSEMTLPFWTAAREGRLIAPRCEGCGTLRFPPRTHCPSCRSEAFGWQTLSGKGIVHTFTVVRQASHAGFAPDVPYALAIIQTDEGLHMLSNVIGCKPEDVRVGMPVEVQFEEITPEISLPKFRPSHPS